MPMTSGMARTSHRLGRYRRVVAPGEMNGSNVMLLLSLSDGLTPLAAHLAGGLSFGEGMKPWRKYKLCIGFNRVGNYPYALSQRPQGSSW